MALPRGGKTEKGRKDEGGSVIRGSTSWFLRDAGDAGRLQSNMGSLDLTAEVFREQCPVVHVDENRQMALLDCVGELMKARLGLVWVNGIAQDEVEIAAAVRRSVDAAAIRPHFSVRRVAGEKRLGETLVSGWKVKGWHGRAVPEG